MEVEPLDHTRLEDLGLNICGRDLLLSSRENPSVDEPEPQLLPNFSPLDVNLGDKRGTDTPINPYRRVFSTWMKFGGNTRDLSSFEEETNKTTTLHHILEEVVHTECGDDVASFKRWRQDDQFEDDVESSQNSSATVKEIGEVFSSDVVTMGGASYASISIEDVEDESS
ncbi:hypothetical protein Tco_0603592 [Tanacetum coccineum]